MPLFYSFGGVSMTSSIHLKERNGHTKSSLKQMRAQGNIPAVVYGKELGSILVTVDEKEILSALKRNSRAILEVVFPTEKKHPVLVQQIQRDTLTGKLLHIDFHQIDMNESIETLVTIHFTGNPAGVKEGGILQIETHAVQVRCMPDKLPETIEVDISELGVGEHKLVSDLKVDDDVEILTDPTATLVTILAMQKADETLEPVASEEESPEAAEVVEK
jgi:large subunit ribosomal protein L25